MVLNEDKRTALLQLTNCISSENVETIEQLSDGKIFCDIIGTLFPETEIELLAKEKQSIIKCEQSKDESVFSNVDTCNSDDTILCGDSETETEKGLQTNYRVVQKSDNEKKTVVTDNDFAIPPSEPAGDNDAVLKSAESIVTDDELAKCGVCDSGSIIEPVAFSKGDNELIRPVKFSNSDDISKRFRLIQHFVDVRYNFKSESVITYSECQNGNELELAGLLAFILSEAVRHYVHMNDPVIQTLSLLDVKVQQDLEQCFNFFINERSKITKKDIIRIFSMPASIKNPSSQEKSYFVTPRRSCSSKYKRTQSPVVSPLEESVYTNSPLKSYFESPIFTREDIVSKEKEISKLRQIIYEDETRRYSLEQKVQDLERIVSYKDREISSIKENNRALLENEHSEECEECIKLKKAVAEKQSTIDELHRIIRANEETTEKLKESYKEDFQNYQLEMCKKMAVLEIEFKNAEKEIRQANEELIKEKRVKNLRGEENRKLKEEQREMKNELEIYKEKLLIANLEKEPKAPVLGECIGVYFKEEKMTQTDISQMGVEVYSKKISVKDMMVQCSEQKIDVECKLTSDVVMSVLPTSNNAKLDTSFRQLSISSSKEVLDEDSNHTPVTTYQYTDSLSKEVPFTENSCSPVTNDGIGSLWNQYNNIFSGNENADEVSSVDNGLFIAINILQQTEFELNQMMKHLSAVSKTSSGPNGSNGLVGLPSNVLKEFLEELKKSVRKSLVFLSQTGETQVKFQNNNSTLKSMMDKAGGNSANAALYSKCFECSKVGSDLPNCMPTINQDNYALLAKAKEIVGLKEENESMKKTQSLKEMELHAYKRKYSHLKSGLMEILRNRKEMEIKYLKLEQELKEARKRESDSKKESQTEKNILKTQIKQMAVKLQRSHNLVLTLQVKVKKLNEENKKLQDERAADKNHTVKLALHIEYLQKQVEVYTSNVHLEATAATSNSAPENKVLLKTEGANVDCILLENTTYDFLKPLQSPSVNEVSSLDSCNESMKSGALCNKSLHSKSGFHPVTDDEESFINYRSLAEIKRKFDSEDVQNSLRSQELKRRNTMYPVHLQSCYPVEGTMTPADKNSSKLVKDKKNSVFPVKKLRVSEMETQNQSNQMLATPTVKTKRRFLETPTSLKKWRFYRRNQRSGSIKPKP